VIICTVLPVKQVFNGLSLRFPLITLCGEDNREKYDIRIMYYVLLGAIVVIAIIGLLKYIFKKNLEFFNKNYYVFPKSFREKIESTDPFKDLIVFINLLLFVLIIFQLGLILVFKFGTPHAVNASIHSLFFWFGKEAGYGKLTVMLFSTAALFIVSYNLSRFLNEYRKRSDIKGIKAFTELRKMLDENKENFEIHRDLHFGKYEFIESPSTKEEETKQMELFRYLGTIELAASMVRKGVINIEQFDKQFGYRIDDIVRCTMLKDYLYCNKESWTDLIWIIRKIEKHRKDNSESTTNNNNPKDKTPHHENEMLLKGRKLIKKGGTYLFDDK